MLVEDLVPCVVRFHTLFPKTRFRFLELPDDEVAEVVDARQADFGFAPTPLTEVQQRSLVAEPAYPWEI
jgi:DNA-binding transcriptional LysR family regulator